MNTNFVRFDNPTGTSFWDGYVKASANEINKVLGNPEFYRNDKVIRVWIAKVNDILFTIYDYKEYRDVQDEDVIRYHIGTKNQEDTNKIVDILKEVGLNAYINKNYFKF